MRRFKIQEIKELSKYETLFYQVIGANYKSGTTAKQDEEVLAIWNSSSGRKEKINFSCNYCSYQFYRRVALKYFEDKDYLKEMYKANLEKARAARKCCKKDEDTSTNISIEDISIEELEQIIKENLPSKNNH